MMIRGKSILKMFYHIYNVIKEILKCFHCEQQRVSKALSVVCTCKLSTNEKRQFSIPNLMDAIKVSISYSIKPYILYISQRVCLCVQITIIRYKRLRYTVYGIRFQPLRQNNIQPNSLFKQSKGNRLLYVQVSKSTCYLIVNEQFDVSNPTVGA